MPNPVQAWHEEHAYFKRMLALLRREMDVFATGHTPNYALMLDILEYLRDWADRYHHPREDEVFRRLVRLAPDRELPVARLRQEHRVIAHAGETLRRLLEEAAADAMVPRAEVEVAAATYLVYYGNHIATEDEDLIPLADRLLGPQDWVAAKDAVAGAADPVRSAQAGARFAELRRRIAAEAG